MQAPAEDDEEKTVGEDSASEETADAGAGAGAGDEGGDEV